MHPRVPTASVPRLGANPTAQGTEFLLYSTVASRAYVELYDAQGNVLGREALEERAEGLFGRVLPAADGILYRFVLDDRVLPDPYARFLPHGVHGPAQIVRSAYAWRSARPVPKSDVVYELHVGTFTEEGTYASAAERLDVLADLGVGTVELMPLSSFAGARGWGYDGVAHYAPFAQYGSPDDLRALVDRAHSLGMRIILDVVYNHFGPDGSYLAAYSPEYFSRSIRTPWGDGPNFENPFLRAYVVHNATYWLTEYRFDGLRLDALHAIIDPSPLHILDEIAHAVRLVMPDAWLVGEDDRNDASLVRSRRVDSVWADDFHHQVRVLLTGDKEGYYGAYRGTVEDLARTIERGFFYEGQVNPVTGSPRGTDGSDLPRNAFVYCIENHDQVGNRAFGSRLSSDCAPEDYAAASMLLLFLPMRPLLFMGQEWSASTPFLYFTDHEPSLGSLVSKGRREEFRNFSAFIDPGMRERIPDPQALVTFESSKLRWRERESMPHAAFLALYRKLVSLRVADPVLGSSEGSISAKGLDGVLKVVRRKGDEARVLWWNLSQDEPSIAAEHVSFRVLAESRPGAIRAGRLMPHSALILAPGG